MTGDHHLRVMRAYRSRLESSAAVSWTVDEMDPREAWREGLARLAATP
jgi:hypothetical protein